MIRKYLDLLKNNKRSLTAILLWGILIYGFLYRINLAKESTKKPLFSGDHSTHLRAVTDLLCKRNPYIWTVSSYNNLENDPNNKGYAYFPGLLYVNSALYILSLSSGISAAYLFKLPGILAHLGVGVFLLLYFSREKKDLLGALFAVSYWVFNFYTISKHSLAGFDSIPILFMLLSLYFLEKDDVLSGSFFSLSVLFKTFAVILFPLYLLKSKKPIHFLIAGFLVAFSFSIPFMGSVGDFTTYVQGALLVHGDRFVQGRPYLYYISYYYSVELFRIIPFGFYSLSSIISGWLLILLNFILGKFKKVTNIENKYVISVLPFLSFYTLTPVLNRTYLLWALPIFLIGSYNFFKKRNLVVFFYVFNVLYWGFCYWYLAQWKDGFHIWHPI